MGKVENGSKVKVHYTGTLENGEVFDSSVGGEPIEFTVGSKQVIPGFESAVTGLSVGEKVKKTLTPEEGYGPVIENRFQEIEKSLINMDIEVGTELQAETPEGVMYARVHEINGDNVILDGNHPFAGKSLTFEIEVVEIN